MLQESSLRRNVQVCMHVRGVVYTPRCALRDYCCDVHNLYTSGILIRRTYSSHNSITKDSDKKHDIVTACNQTGRSALPDSSFNWCNLRLCRNACIIVTQKMRGSNLPLCRKKMISPIANPAGLLWSWCTSCRKQKRISPIAC